ncbi:hypothetical protein L484_003266 [Morus notabilis]|uniref:Uncharacterized protein n=1 Tax=Morus notabilis TaxID=981085 RepID=W9QT60_9ROSA|nr:hypothetical protein L484_003266 [Morus notabilis]
MGLYFALAVVSAKLAQADSALFACGGGTRWMIAALFVRRHYNGLRMDPAATGKSAQPVSFDSDSSAKIIIAAFARASLESFLSPRLSYALGDYTRMINDFAIFPADPTEGQVGTYWYQEGTQAYFDDLDRYKIIKAMCRLSCSVCDKTNERSKVFTRKGEFKNVEHLRSHLIHRHGLLMCSLCLESRKIHFRQAHFLCEDEACLEKKFVVYATESEMKRHNVMEHGGRMSRCKRLTSLQIPISFHYRRGAQQDRHGRGRRFPSDRTEIQLPPSIQASLETANAESSRGTLSSAGAVSNHRETSEFESVGSFEVLATVDSEPSSISSDALRQIPRTARLEDSSFPPLPAAPSRGKKKRKNAFGGLDGNSTASLLHPQNNAALSIRNNSPAWLAANRPPNLLGCSSQQPRHVLNSGRLSSSSSPSILHSRSTTRSTHLSPSYESTVSVSLVKSHEPSSSGTGSSSRNSTTKTTFTHSASLLNLTARGFSGNSISSFPPVSAVLTAKSATSILTLLKAEDVNSANKSLVVRIRVALENDEKKYAAFKEISSKYRHDLINTEEYLACVCQFGLSHLVLELARLCPDPEKQKELVETYNFNTRGCGSHVNNLGNDSGLSKNMRSLKKGKEKCQENEISAAKDVLVESIISSMKKLESNYKSLVDRTDVLSKDDPHSAKGKSKILVDDKQSQNGSQSNGDSSKKNLGNGGAGNKHQKKTSKFLRNRLGSDAATVIEHGGSDASSDMNEVKIDEDKDPPEGLPVCGVWKNGGGQRLMAMTQRNHRKR